MVIVGFELFLVVSGSYLCFFLDGLQVFVVVFSGSLFSVLGCIL